MLTVRSSPAAKIAGAVSVTAEVLLLSPIAVVVLWQVHSGGQGAFGSGHPQPLGA